MLEYRNAYETDELIREPWYAVHPVVKELHGFKQALRTLETEEVAK